MIACQFKQELLLCQGYEEKTCAYMISAFMADQLDRFVEIIRKNFGYCSKMCLLSENLSPCFIAISTS
jgi:hypothetical protein